jgi:predicted RNA binding protein YcfA (HicA-like mRNA interferase family)
MLHREGWMRVATKGSLRQLNQAEKIGHATVASKPSDVVAPGTCSSMLKQAGTKR